MSGCSGCSFKGASTDIEDTFIGVRFAEETNLTLCRTGGVLFAKGDRVIVEQKHGPAHGWVEKVPMPVFKPCQKSSARDLLREANSRDIANYERKVRNELSAKIYARQRARELGLQMKVSTIEFSLSSKSARLLFTAEHRIDFRELVRDLSQRFSARMRMVQVGARDEAGILGGIGVCGRTLCCSTWLTDFRPISIQMAKRQNLSLNPSKISGQCGRLLCCLSYEDENYKTAASDKKRQGLTQLSKGAQTN